MIHVTALESMAAELNGLGVNITEHDLVTTVMCSLPDRFEMLEHSWQNLTDDLRTMDTLRERIAFEERRLIRKGGALPPAQKPPDAALPAFGGQAGPPTRGMRGWRGGRGRGGGGRDTFNRDNVVCHYCGKARHYEFECRLRIAQQGEQQQAPPKRPTGDSEEKHRPGGYSLISICCLAGTDPHGLYLDSGATRHMSGLRDYFHDLSDLSPAQWPVSGIGGTVLHATGVGTLKLSSLVHGTSTFGDLNNVLYVPGLGVNLISIVCLAINGCSVSFDGLKATVRKGGNVILTASRSGEALYKLHACVSTSSVLALSAATSQATLNVWHERLGHVNRRTVQRMASGIGVRGMLITPGAVTFDECCHGCELGKMHKLPFSKSTTVYNSVGDCIVSDLVGPFQTPSVGGARYYVLFKDVFSKFKTVYFLKHKSETTDCFLQYSKSVFNVTGHRVKLLRCDGGTEFINHSLQTALTDLGIQLETSAAYTPEQNGIAERDHRSTVESARSQLHARGVPLKLWAEAVNYAVYVLNRTLSQSKSTTPFERWYGAPPDVSNLRIFGSVAYFFIPDALRQKLDPKAKRGVYVGESEEQKASRIFDDSTGRTHVTRHVKVYENLPYWTSLGSLAPTKLAPSSETLSPDHSVVPPAVLPPATTPSDTRVVGIPIRRSLRGLIPRKLFPMDDDSVGSGGFIGTLSMTSLISLALKTTSLYYEPKTYKEAMTGSEGALWKVAADHEIAAHAKNQTWTLTPLPPGRVCIPSGWDFKVKTDRLGQPCRRKARFFAKGYRQVQGIDYQESFAPVVRYDSLRVILALAAARDLEIVQLDVTTAFLNGVIDEVLYIAQPEGYVVPGRSEDVCRLNKGIYGICQASRIWNKTLHAALLDFGLVQSTADPCVYYYITASTFLIIAVWVDDGLVAGSSMALITDLVTFLNRRFEITAIPADLFVGIVLTRDRARRRIYLSIPQFIDKVLQTFQLSTAHPVSLPVLKGSARLSEYLSPSTPAEIAAMSTIPFRQIVGCLMYAALTVRVDIAFMAGQLAQHCQNPGMEHWKAATRVLKYLAFSRNHGICFDGNGPVKNVLVGYSDADYAGDPDGRRSTSGYVFILNGGAVTWSSRKQPIVALSTMESEYIAASDSSREAVWLRGLLTNLGISQSDPTVLRCDNESAINLAHNPLAHKGSKHIQVRYHFIREQVAGGTIKLEYVDTTKQLADVLTKAVDGATYLKCLDGFGLREVPE